MKVPEGSEVPSKGSKRFPGSKVKVEEVARFEVRVPSQCSRRGFQVQVRFRKVPKFQVRVLRKGSKGFGFQVRVPSEGSKRFQSSK